MHEFAVVDIEEVGIVLWVSYMMIKYDEQEELRFLFYFYRLYNFLLFVHSLSV